MVCSCGKHTIMWQGNLHLWRIRTHTGLIFCICLKLLLSLHIQYVAPNRFLSSEDPWFHPVWTPCRPACVTTNINTRQRSSSRTVTHQTSQSEVQKVTLTGLTIEQQPADKLTRQKGSHVDHPIPHHPFPCGGNHSPPCCYDSQCE